MPWVNRPANGSSIPAWPAAFRAMDVLPGRMMFERITGAVERDVFRQRHRQVRLGHRDDAAVLAMNNRDRAAPIPLPRNPPVAQAKIDLTMSYGTVARAFVLQSSRNFLLRFRDRHAIKEPRVDHAAITLIGCVGDDEAFRILALRTNHRCIAQTVFVYEVKVALIVRRATEDRARAVLHQNEICHIDWQLPRRIKRMNRAYTCIDPFLFSGLDYLLRGAPTHGLGDEFSHFFIFRRGREGEYVIGRDGHEFRAKQSVRPRGEDLQLTLCGRYCIRIERETNQ